MILWKRYLRYFLFIKVLSTGWTDCHFAVFPWQKIIAVTNPTFREFRAQARQRVFLVLGESKMHCFCSQDHCEIDQCTVCIHLSQDHSMQSSESTLREWRGPDNEGLVPVLDGWHEDVVETVEAVEAVEVRVAVELINDLKAAVEVDSSEGRRVLYPDKSLQFDSMPLEIAVSIWDDPSIQHTCKEFVGTQLFTSSGFGNFGTEAQQNFGAKVSNSTWWRGLLVFLVVCIIVPLELT